MAESKEKNHINIANKAGEVFCRRMNDVVKLEKNAHVCETCPFFAGTAQGEGVECVWEDDRDSNFLYINNPHKEMEDVLYHDFEQLVEDDNKESTKKKK